MIWILGFVLLLIGLLIPILAIVLDSPVARNLVRGPDPRVLEELAKRIQALEDEVADLGNSVESLREETQFVQRLLKKPDGANSSQQFPQAES